MDDLGTYIKIVEHLSRDSVIIGEVVISKRHQYPLTLSPMKSKDSTLRLYVFPG